jgi:pimeloyl-ACP methyl ester carboxylesterase
MKYDQCFFLLIFFLLWQDRIVAQSTHYGSNAAVGKYASINGIKLYYEIYGKGFPLFLFHGNGGSIRAFEKQIPALSAQYRVIAVDSRLQGRSGGNADTLSYTMMADDFCALMDYLHVKSCFVLGWSDGGIDAIRVALQCPQKIKAIAFTGANIFMDSTVINQLDIDGMLQITKSTTTTKLEKTLNKMMLYQPDMKYSDLHGVQCPALVMAGDADIIKPTHTLQIFQSIPKAQLCIFPNANHGVCQQYPLLFNEVVLTFFKNFKK